MKLLKYCLLLLSFAFVTACNSHNADDPSNSSPRDPSDPGAIRTTDSMNRIASDTSTMKPVNSTGKPTGDSAAH